MIYVMSDIHGCYYEYLEMLKKLDFSDSDTLFVLGDVVDRGPEPIKLLQDMMLRPNIFPLLGNHEYMALTILEKLNVEITEGNVVSHLNTEDVLDYIHWTQDGGDITAQQFSRLDRAERLEILDYLQEFSLYEDITVGKKRFVLTHAGLYHFDENKALEDYYFTDFLFYRTDYAKRYYKDTRTFLVTGHTPTIVFRKDRKALVYEKKGHIAIDCGCVFGHKLAAYCLDTGKTTYVDSKQPLCT